MVVIIWFNYSFNSMYKWFFVYEEKNIWILIRNFNICYKSCSLCCNNIEMLNEKNIYIRKKIYFNMEKNVIIFVLNDMM